MSTEGEPQGVFETFQGLFAGTAIIRQVDGFAQSFVKACQSTTDSFWNRFLSIPIAEGFKNERLTSIDERFDDELQKFLASLSSLKWPSESQKVLGDRFVCSQLAISLVDHAKEAEPGISELVLLAARRTLLYAVKEIESTEQKIVDKEWLNGFIQSVQNRKIELADLIKFIYDPPVVN